MLAVLTKAMIGIIYRFVLILMLSLSMRHGSALSEESNIVASRRVELEHGMGGIL